MNKSLSDHEVIELTDGKTHVLPYSELSNYNNINDIFKNDSFVLLYEFKQNYGHYCCVLKYGKRITFFDPYGIFPDKELGHISEDFRILNNEKYPYLSELLLDAYNNSYTIEFNQHQYQEMKKGINTCGRHCAVRIWKKDLNTDQFNEWFTDLLHESGLKSYDKLVYKLTKYI